MPVKTTRELEESLEHLYYSRQLLRDIFVLVLMKYGRGTPQRKDFLTAKNSVDLAIIDMENASLGGIARRMAEAAPEIRTARRKLNGRLDDLNSVKNSAKKASRALESIEKALKLVL